jgi:outer membrane protein assembly factor BamA
MSDEKIKVTAERFRVKRGSYAKAILIKMEKDNFQTSVKIPIGDEVSSKEFALAIKALYQASVVFHHRVYDGLREKMEELNKGFEKSPALLEKDQRGA